MAVTGEVRPRRANEDDVPAIAHVHRLSRASYYGTQPDPADGREEMWAELVARPGQLTWVAADARGVVGFAAAIRVTEPRPAFELTSLYVLPETFGTGVGSLLHERYDAARRDGEEGVLEVWAGNARAIAFYRARGWVPTTATRPGPRAVDFVTYRLSPRGRQRTCQRSPSNRK